VQIKENNSIFLFQTCAKTNNVGRIFLSSDCPTVWLLLVSISYNSLQHPNISTPGQQKPGCHQYPIRELYHPPKMALPSSDLHHHSLLSVGIHAPRLIDDETLKKITAEIFFSFFDQKLQFTYL
jgi:hypothetical protein